MCNGCELTTEEKQRIIEKSTDFYQKYSKESIDQHLSEYINKYPDRSESIEGMIGAMFAQVIDELRHTESALRKKESRIEKIEKELKNAIKGKWKYYANKIQQGRNT